MFTFPHNTTVYLLKNPIDMRYGMFRLQGVIADMLQHSMPRDSFYFFINRSVSTVSTQAKPLYAVVR